MPESRPLMEAYPQPEREVAIIGDSLPPINLRLAAGDAAPLDGEVMAYAGEEEARPSRSGIVHTGERSLLHEFSAFLSEVDSASRRDIDQTRAQEMQGLAARFMHESTFLSRHDYERAVRGLASRQVAFLHEGANREVLFFVSPRRTQHSQGKIAEDMHNALLAQDQDEQTTGRVAVVSNAEELQTHLASHESPEDIRLVLGDDWAVTGNNIANEASHLCRMLQQIGLYEMYKDRIEANLLVVRQDQVDDHFRALESVEDIFELERMDVVGFFRAPAAAPFEGPVPSGAHASVDYGFSQPIARLKEYLESQTGKSRNLPLIANIKRSYRE